MKRKTLVILFLILLLLAAVIGLKYALRSYDEASYPLEYSGFVEKSSKAYNVDKALIYAVIRTESSFKPDVVSSIGARGLMQITEPTFEWARSKMGSEFQNDTYDDLFDPETNITYGTFLLSAFIKEFGSSDNALCAYHAGWGNAKAWLADREYSPDGENITNIPFGDTEWYVNKINEVRLKYIDLYFSKGE